MAEEAQPAPRHRPRRARVSAVVAVALAAAFVTWLVVGRDGDETAQTTTAPLVGTTPSGTESRPAIVSLAALRSAAASSDVPIYWVGARRRTSVELTRVPNGTVFVRYVPPSVAAGDLRKFLTVATYPRPDAFDEVGKAARAPDARTIRLAGGGIAVYNGARPTNVHIGYPGQRYQVEVFAPEPGLVTQLASSGAIRPVS